MVAEEWDQTGITTSFYPTLYSNLTMPTQTELLKKQVKKRPILSLFCSVISSWRSSVSGEHNMGPTVWVASLLRRTQPTWPGSSISNNCTGGSRFFYFFFFWTRRCSIMTPDDTGATMTKVKWHEEPRILCHCTPDSTPSQTSCF